MNSKTDNAPAKRSVGSNSTPMKKNIGRESGYDESDDPVYAGFWIRFVASLIDGIIAVIVCLPIAYLLRTKVEIMAYVVIAVATIFFWIAKQATPGKMVFKMRIADAETLEAPSAGQCVLRYVGYLVSSLAFGLGYIWAAFDERKQGWHDKIAKTVVVFNKDG